MDFPEGPASDLSTLTTWLESLGHSGATLERLVGDVSFRRYVRVRFADGTTCIAALYPESMHGACDRFLQTTRLLQEVEVPVPEVVYADCAGGRMLLQDVGRKTLYERAAESVEPIQRWFREAVRLADRIATVPEDSVRDLNPPLNSDLLRVELQQTWTLFAKERTPTILQPKVLRLFSQLCDVVGGGRLVPCHRDFMVRNLVPREDPPELVVLDHQDMRLGPRHYDLASLLNDSLFPSPALESSLLGDRLASQEDHLEYHRTAAQRTLKAVGSYSAAAAIGRKQHLSLVQPTLERTFDHLAKTPEGEALVNDLREAWG